jgi:hypothetical protein
MKIYTSRFSNPKLRGGIYTAVRISLGKPRYRLGYNLDAEMQDLMPAGILGKYDNDKEGYRREYFARLDRKGAQRIRQQLDSLAQPGKDIVLLCFEDIRKEGDWCHRTMFAEWWMERTGELIGELPEASLCPPKEEPVPEKATPPYEQPGLF